MCTLTHSCAMLLYFGVGGYVGGDNLTILVLASYWLKNVTYNSKIAPKSHQGACRAATLRTFSQHEKGAPPPRPTYIDPHALSLCSLTLLGPQIKKLLDPPLFKYT